MAFRGTESPMDFEWQGHGPVDVNSPFHKLAMENQRKRTRDQFDSPGKPSLPQFGAPNSQPWFFSNPPPPATDSSPYRNPSFTTPRKPIDIDFSSGPESSPVDLADTEDTPDGKPAPMQFTGTKSPSKRNSLFNMYGRFAPSPGRGEIKKPFNNSIAKKVHKKRRRAQQFSRELVLDRRSSEDTSDDDAQPIHSQSTEKGQQPQVHQVGWMTGLFTFIHAYPDAPSIIAKYLQVFFNAAILGGCLFMLWSFYATIQAEVERASNDAKAEILSEMAACSKNYVENLCGAANRLPALEQACNNWELCMNRDPDTVKRASLSAHTFAEIFNSFVEPISLKTSIFTITIVALGLLINNVTFSSYRRAYEHSHEYRAPSGQYMHPGAQMSNLTPFPATPGLYYGQHQQPQHQMGWHGGDYGEQRQRLNYQKSPSKEYGRSRSRSPEKKRLMM